MPAARSSRFVDRLAIALLLCSVMIGAAGATPIRFRTIAPSNSGVFSFFFQAVGDVDGDHFPDLVGLQSGNVLWSKNTAGVLGPAQPVTMPFGVTTFATGDLDGDGRSDLVACNTGAANGVLAILHSNAPNIDPETAFSAGNQQGLEMGQLPSTRSLGFQISVTP